MEAELKLYQKKHRLIYGSLGIALLFVALVVMLITGPDPESVFAPLRIPEIFYSLAVAGLALTLYLLHFAAGSLRNPRPRVILSGQGIIVDGFSGRFSARWEEFSFYALNGPSIYVLQLSDRQAFINSLPPGRMKETARVLSDKFGSPFLIEMNMLDANTNAVRAFLGRHLEEQPA